MSMLREIGFGCGILLALGSATSVHAQALQSSAAVVSATVLEDPVRVAYRDFARTGDAKVIYPKAEGGFVLFPFGHERPTIRCPRLNACLIALEPGEGLTDEPLSGDTERWIIVTSVMGRTERSVLIVIKPQFCDISTNLVIPTDRRVYELSLASDPCEPGGTPERYTRQVKFWYPAQLRAERSAEQEISVVAEEAPPELNRDYNVDRGWFLNRKRYPWIPSDVFDDGVRTYIVLPERARNGELPILYMLEGGERHVLNYALRGDTIVADRVIRRALLTVGSGDGERKVEIENRQPFAREEEPGEHKG